MKETPYRCCRRCLHWLPETTEFFPRYTSASSGERVLRRTCRQCVKDRQARIALADAEIARVARSRPSKRASPKDGTAAAMSAWRLRSE